MFEADYATTMRQGEPNSLLSKPIESWRWSGWQRFLWPAGIVRSGLEVYVYNLKSRRFIALMKVTLGGSFHYTSKQSFVKEVEKLTQWTPDSRDPHWPKLPEGRKGAECVGIALRWKLLKVVDIPFEVRVPRIGWLSLLHSQAPSAGDLGSEFPSRTNVKVSRIVRDTRLVLHLKNLHQHKCQLCGHTIDLLNGQSYSEGHHLKPVGAPHNGPDKAENILILCPNCHALCDLAAITLDASSISMRPDHTINQNYIDHHNDRVAKRLHQP